MTEPKIDFKQISAEEDHVYMGDSLSLHPLLEHCITV